MIPAAADLLVSAESYWKRTTTNAPLVACAFDCRKWRISLLWMRRISFHLAIQNLAEMIIPATVWPSAKIITGPWTAFSSPQHRGQRKTGWSHAVWMPGAQLVRLICFASEASPFYFRKTRHFTHRRSRFNGAPHVWWRKNGVILGCVLPSALRAATRQDKRRVRLAWPARQPLNPTSQGRGSERWRSRREAWISLNTCAVWRMPGAGSNPDRWRDCHPMARFSAFAVMRWTRSSGPWARLQWLQGIMWPGGSPRPCAQKMVAALKTMLPFGPGKTIAV